MLSLHIRLIIIDKDREQNVAFRGKKIMIIYSELVSSCVGVSRPSSGPWAA